VEIEDVRGSWLVLPPVSLGPPVVSPNNPAANDPIRLGLPRSSPESDTERRSVALVRVRFFSPLCTAPLRTAPCPLSKARNVHHALQSVASRRPGRCISFPIPDLSLDIISARALGASFGNVSRAIALSISESTRIGRNNR
jgi:hypothetical protein